VHVEKVIGKFEWNLLLISTHMSQAGRILNYIFKRTLRRVSSFSNWRDQIVSESPKYPRVILYIEDREIKAISFYRAQHNPF
jgi:hypothetical protein